MSATDPSIMKVQDLMSYGLIESASVRSITDFNLSKLKESEINLTGGQEKEDFINTLICHFIFYAFFALHV